MYEIEKKKDYVRVLLISDLHLCNKKDRMDLVHKAYNYALKEHIRYVLNLGDLIDGVMTHNEKDIKIDSVSKQIDYVVNEYPYSSNIKTLVLYGNHDYYSLVKDNIDVGKEIYLKRKDIYSLGYGESYIRILDNYMKLSHDIDFLKGYKKNLETFINLLGHLHEYKVKLYDDNLYIHVPSLSDLKPNGDKNIPSILDIRFSFYRDIISGVTIDCIDMERDLLLGNYEYVGIFSNKKYMKIKEKMKETIL